MLDELVTIRLALPADKENVHFFTLKKKRIFSSALIKLLRQPIGCLEPSNLLWNLVQ